MSIVPKLSLLNPSLQRPSALDSKPRSCESLWLDKNENLDPELLAVNVAVLNSIPAIALATYPEAGSLYRKLSKWVGVNQESLLLTHGSDGAIRLTFEAFVQHGEGVIHTAPTFAMYQIYSQIYGALVHRIDYEPSNNGPHLDVGKIIKLLRDYKPKLLCLPNPNSPTGTVIEPGVLYDLLKECERSGTVFLIDEAYHPFFDWTASPWTATSRHLIIARTFAKAWGVAGLRIGYAIAHPDTVRLLHKIRPMYEVSTLAVEFMDRMLDKVTEMEKSVARINQGKAYFTQEMRGLNFNTLQTYGNFVHVNFGDAGGKIHSALAGKVLYRSEFGDSCLKGFSRFSVAPPDIMFKVVKLIKTTLNN
jgi:histidinol-phosphate aminotransferase